MSVIQFPSTERGELAMAKATVHSIPLPPAKPRFPQVMPTMAWPRLCGRPHCHHVRCRQWRAQAALPCGECHQIIAVGEKFFVTDVDNGVVVRQVHADTCPDRTP